MHENLVGNKVIDESRQGEAIIVDGVVGVGGIGGARAWHNRSIHVGIIDGDTDDYQNYDNGDD